MKEKMLHLTHNDADAVGCAVVMNFCPKYEVETKFCAIGKVDQILLNSIDEMIEKEVFADEILISDIGIHEETVSMLDTRLQYIFNTFGHSIEIRNIDHHKTNRLSEKYSWATLKMVDESGIPISAARLVLDEYRSQLYLDRVHIIEEYVNDISRYDTWEWKRNPTGLMEEEYTNIIIKTFGIEKCYEMICENIAKGSTPFNNIMMLLIDNYKTRRESYLEKVNENTVTVMFPYVNMKIGMVLLSDSFYNETLEHVYLNNPDIDFVIGLSPKGKTLSFRKPETSSVDLSTIAQIFGGGGHANAAGATDVNTDAFVLLMKIYYNKMEEKKNNS